MSNCYIMIGLPASGKDYYIERNKEEDDVVVSSDEIREELFGDVNDQKHNGEVFNEMFKRTCAALKMDRMFIIMLRILIAAGALT